MIFWFCLLATSVYLWLEKMRLRRWLKAIPLRLHVYGTRGKTTTTRLLFERLRQADYRVLGKTTGDVPQLLLPDGHTRPISRLAPANILEYIRCLKKAHQLGCDSVVFECMAITPETITVARDILAPSHLVLTNTRPDHYETMGTTPLGIVQTLALSIGEACTVIANEDVGSQVLQRRAAQFGNPFYGVPECVSPPLQQAHRLVEASAHCLGLPVATQTVEDVWPHFVPYSVAGQGFAFLDLFSANDVYSSNALLQQALVADTRYVQWPLVALLATRTDRPLRTRAFIEWLSPCAQSDLRPPVAFCLALGGHMPYAAWHLSRRMPHGFLPMWQPMCSPVRMLSMIRARVGENFRLVGLGNAHGYGEKLRSFLARL